MRKASRPFRRPLAWRHRSDHRTASMGARGPRSGLIISGPFSELPDYVSYSNRQLFRCSDAIGVRGNTKHGVRERNSKRAITRLVANRLQYPLQGMSRRQRLLSLLAKAFLGFLLKRHFGGSSYLLHRELLN